MEPKYTHLELHMLKTLREIYANLDAAQDTRLGYLALIGNARSLAAPFCITGPSNAELDKLIAADREAQGWPTQETK